MQLAMLRITGVLATLLLAGFGVVAASADEHGVENFRQDPTIDFRSVILDITTDTDAQFEIVVANPTINGETALSGELVFRVPPGVTIYSSLLGGTGGTGIVQVPFTSDPISPGNTKTFTFFARSTEVGNLAVFSSITYWPHGNMDLAHTVNRQFPITVKEPSKLQGLPGEIEQELGITSQETMDSQSGSFSLSGDDNPLGWPNWFLILVVGTILAIFIAILAYRLIRAKIEY